MASATATATEDRRSNKQNFPIACSREFVAWMHRLGEHMRRPVSCVIDQGVIELAKRAGFDEPAPRR